MPLVVFFAFSQQVKGSKTEKTVIVSGKIKRNKSKEVTVTQGDNSYSTSIDKKGNFKMQFEIVEEGFLKCEIGDEYAMLYLTPGDSIFLTLDTKAFDETLKFTGKGKEINNYLIGKLLLNEKMYMKASEKFSAETNEFVRKTDSIYHVLKKHFEELESHGNISKNFLKFEKAKLLYSFANDRLVYYEKFKYFTNREPENIDDNYYSFLSKLNMNDASLLEMPEYIDCLKNFLEAQTYRKLKSDTSLKNVKNAETITKINIISETFTNPDFYNMALVAVMEDQIQHLKVDDSIMANLKDKFANEKDYNKLNTFYKQSLALGKGKKAPTFTLPDLKGKMVSLENFAGKYVYIDVWSTRCGPCIKEMPYFIELQKKYKNQNIAFISIALDERLEAWKKMIEKKGFTGLQLRAKEVWDSPFAKAYFINELPCSILIDPKGNIINARTPKPSEMDSILAELLVP
jgi:thiol-disulfide isomerase/thioredoxin